MSTTTVGSEATADPADVTLSPYAGRIEQAELQIRNLIATYEVIAEWIRFADTKAALVLTVNGIFASFVISSISELAEVTPSPSGIVAYCMFAAWALFAALSGLEAFRWVLPRKLNAVHPAVASSPHFHPAAIAAHYAIDERDAIVGDFDRLSSEDFRNEVLQAIVIEAYISKSKYRHVVASIRFLAAMATFGFTYFAMLSIAS